MHVPMQLDSERGRSGRFRYDPSKIRASASVLHSITSMLARHTDRSQMRGNGILDAPTISAADRDRDRYSDLATEIEHHRVAPREAVERQREAAEAIALVRICSGDV